MPFDQFKYNFKIHCLLRKLAKQRVTVIHPKNKIWLIEYAVEDNEENNNLLETCYMRGWVEPLEQSVPKGKVNIDGTLQEGPFFQNEGTVWKLTDSGWSAINRSHQLVILSIFLSILSIITSI